MNLKKERNKDLQSILFCSDFLKSKNTEDEQEKFNKDSSLVVSVLIAKSQHNKVVDWLFISEKGFEVTDGDHKIVTHIIKIRIKNNVAWWNGKRLKKSLNIRPFAGYAECNGIVYDGNFSIVPYNGIFLCINKVDLEEYITAVLKTESWPGWPLEVNKVFAITSRSYVVFKMLEAHKNNRPFHVKNTNSHQTYKGKHTVEVLKKAVEQTRGIILGFNGSPALTMFDSCCGGITPANIEDFAFEKAPYLARTYPCTFCRHFSLFSWSVKCLQSDFELILLQSGYNIVSLCDIQINKKDKAGLVSEVMIKDAVSTITLSGKTIYSYLENIKSFCFNIEKQANIILFTGYGWGHHLGLCQWGARRMVTEGWDFKSILRFYFPGTYFMKLK